MPVTKALYYVQTYLMKTNDRITYSSSKLAKTTTPQSQDLLKAKASEAVLLASSWLLIATALLSVCLLWKVMILCELCLQMPTHCLLYTSPSPRDLSTSRMPSSA